MAMSKAKRAALYLRVSTGEQITGNQRRELEAAAAVRGRVVVAVCSKCWVWSANSSGR
jgi:DNA invertase Pin-like site-specific DNA recombinase